MSAPTGTPRELVLVVDDVDDNRLLLLALLEQDRYELVEARSGPEALACVARRRPDLILLDVSMPGMDGFEVLERLSAGDAREVPVVLITAAASEPEHVERGIALGAVEYVKKPIDGAELRARVRGILRVEKLRREVEALRRDHQAMVVHDLRHPVGKLGLIAELLDSDDDMAATQRRAHAQTIRRICDEMTHLVDGVLEVARIDAGLVRAERRPTDVAALLEVEARPFEALGARRRLTLELDVGAAGHATLDGPALGQAVQNLLANALKFTPKGGRLRLEAHQAAGRLHVAVDDSGPGVAAADAPFIFDRYRQAAGARARGSAGLGLAIVRAVAEAHGGQARLAPSRLGGARFELELPV